MNDFAAGYRTALADVEYLLRHGISAREACSTLRKVLRKYENNPDAILGAKLRMEEDAAEAQP